jgi:hypothetical protein
MIDVNATLAMVRVANPPLPEETDEAYASRTLHLTYLLVEHSPQDAVLLPVQDMSVSDTNEEKEMN